jgi:hypothetical protein
MQMVSDDDDDDDSYVHRSSKPLNSISSSRKIAKIVNSILSMITVVLPRVTFLRLPLVAGRRQ